MCADGWDDDDATVVCRQLGFSPRGVYSACVTDSKVFISDLLLILQMLLVAVPVLVSTLPSFWIKSLAPGQKSVLLTAIMLGLDFTNALLGKQ